MHTTLVSRSTHSIAFSLAFILLVATNSGARQGAKREYLTPQEIDLIRDNQDLDKRTQIFVKAAERRLLSMTAPAAAPSKQTAKEIEKWGELPKGTRAELFSDIARIFDEAITNIDDTATRSPDSPLLPKAVKQLAAAAANFLTQLAPLRDSATAGPERESLEQALDEMQEIIEAAKKIPDVKSEK